MASKKRGGGIIATGFKEVDRKLASLVPKVQRQVVRKAMRAGMRHVLTEARHEAPEDTGRLKRAIKLRAAKRRKRGVFGVNVQVSRKDFDGEYYAPYVEFGTEAVPAQPYMRPAFDAKNGQAKKTTIEAILGGVEAVVEGRTPRVRGGEERPDDDGPAGGGGGPSKPRGGPKRDARGRFIKGK